MSSFSLINGQVLLTDSFEAHDVVVQGGKVKLVGEAVGNAETIDLNGMLVSPGFIDLHFHGVRDKTCTRDDLGWIKPGRSANLTVLDDSGQVTMTIVDGEIVYRKGL